MIIRLKAINAERLNSNEFFFYIAWSIIMIGKGLNLAGEDALMRLITYVGILFSFIGVINVKYTKTEFVRILLLITIGVMVFLVGKKATVLLSIILVCASKNVSYEKLIKIAFWIRMPMLFITVFLATKGLIQNSIDYDYRYGKTLIRYGLGVGHANTAHMVLFIIIAMYLYLYYTKITWKSIITILIIDYWFYQKTMSRTGFFMVILATVLVSFYKSNLGYKFVIIRKLGLYFMSYLYIIMALFSFITSLIYVKSNIAKLLNNVISSRFSAGYYFLNKYPFNLFGKYIDQESYPLDNAYLYAYIAYGSVIFFITILLLVLLSRKYYKNGMTRELIILSVFSLYGVSENYLFNIIMNFSLLFMHDIIFNRKQKKLKSEIVNNSYLYD